MSRKSVVTVTWTCDVCGTEAPEVDGYSPRGWTQVAHALASAKLGNAAARHLCEHCSESLTLLLAHQLGDTGDMEIAWDEGAAAFAKGEGSDANPYRRTTVHRAAMTAQSEGGTDERE